MVRIRIVAKIKWFGAKGSDMYQVSRIRHFVASSGATEVWDVVRKFDCLDKAQRCLERLAKKYGDENVALDYLDSRDNWRSLD